MLEFYINRFDKEKFAYFNIIEKKNEEHFFQTLNL